LLLSWLDFDDSAKGPILLPTQLASTDSVAWLERSSIFAANSAFSPSPIERCMSQIQRLVQAHKKQRLVEAHKNKNIRIDMSRKKGKDEGLIRRPERGGVNGSP
jgi:hypothetical protein